MFFGVRTISLSKLKCQAVIPPDDYLFIMFWTVVLSRLSGIVWQYTASQHLPAYPAAAKLVWSIQT